MILQKLNLIQFRLSISKIILLVILTINSSIISQTRVDSLEYLGNVFKVNLLNTRFEKQLNTFYLNSRFQLMQNIDKVSIRINENFSSTFIRNESKNTRDEQHFNLNTKYLLSKNFSLGIAGSSSLLSDNRSFGINESAVNYAALFGEVSPAEKIRISPFGGYLNNRQIGTADNGTIYGLEGLLDNLNWSDLNINSELRFRNEDIIPRRNLIRYYALSVANNFDRNINNNIKTNFSQNRKDFYFEADSITSSSFNINNNIQSRTETVYRIFDRLSYSGFLEYFTLDLAGGINWRKIDRDIRYKTSELLLSSLYDTKIDELKLEFDATTSYSSKFFNGTLRLNYYERDEKHQIKKFDGMSEAIFEQKSELEEQKNNNSSRATLSLYGNLKLSRNDLITISLYQSKLIFDTKSPLNDDDRDELLSMVRLRYLKRLSPYFSAFINAEGTYGHTVYLFASRSSNNNENRIFRFRTGGDYTGSFIKSFNSFEVSANYTVYDFQDLTANYQSYAFRQLTAIDSTTIQLSKDLSLFTYGYLKYSEIGDFKWDNFTSKPTRFLKEIYFEPRFILNFNRSIFSAGLRMFILNTYKYNKNDKIIDTEYLSIGPVALIDILAWNNLDLIVKGYFEFISSTNATNKEQVSLLLQVNWKF